MKPIIFNTEMTKSILENRKTVKRRPVKPQETDWEFSGMENDPHMTRIDRSGEEYPSQESGIWAAFEWGAAVRLVKAPYQPGDILYVRETWAAWSRTMGIPPALYYKVDGNAPDGIKWRPSIHMPREAARIFLRVKDVRVERLQDITENEAQKEGLRYYDDICRDESWHPTFYDPDSGGDPSTVEGFSRLWETTIKPADRALYGWDANPWVWVIEFERISREEALS